MQLTEIATGFVSANSLLTQNTETVVATSETILNPKANARAVVYGYAQLTTAATTTTITPGIRRGTTIGGTLVGERNAVTIPTAAGGTDVYALLVAEEIGALDELVYVYTLTDAGAAAGGTVLQAGIVVFLL